MLDCLEIDFVTGFEIVFDWKGNPSLFEGLVILGPRFGGEGEDALEERELDSSKISFLPSFVVKL